MRYNRKFLLGLLALGIILSCTQNSKSNQQMSEKVYEKVKKTTVQVKRYSDEKDTGGGSGFFVTPDQIVTNIHVVAGKEETSVIGMNGTKYEVEGVIGFDPEHDLVILQVNPESDHLHLGTGKIDDQIFVAGFPGVESEKRQEYAVKKGTISNIWNKNKQLRLVPINTKDSIIPPGISGGPIVNHDGEVVGVAVAEEKTDDIPISGFAASAVALKDLLDKSRSADPKSLSDWQEEPCVRAYVFCEQGEDKIAKAESEEEAAIQKQLYSEGIKYFDKATKLCPNYTKAQFGLGRAKFLRDESSLSRDQCKAMIDAFTKAIDLNQDYYLAYYYRGIAHLGLGEYDKTIKDWTEVIKRNLNYGKAIINMLNPDDADSYNLRGVMKTILGKSKVGQGNIAEVRRHYNEAINDFNKALEWNQQEASVYSHRGYTNYLLGKSFKSESGQKNMEHAQNLYEEAIADSNKAIQLNSESASAYGVRGFSKAVLKNYVGAIADLSTAIELKPDFAEAYWERGLVYQKIGQQKKAAADLKKAKELDPNLEK